ncbi:MAG: hypothetical protein IJG62_01010, partial [Synergistaceae bacterium]|nr:hypothetical protein [Synergistaceae bacterium]
MSKSIKVLLLTLLAVFALSCGAMAMTINLDSGDVTSGVNVVEGTVPVTGVVKFYVGDTVVSLDVTEATESVKTEAGTTANVALYGAKTGTAAKAEITAKVE